MNIADALAALDHDDWEGAHRIVQSMDSQPAAWLHGVLHMMEGDETNAQYWYRRAGRPYPGTARIKQEIQAIKEASLG
jgi:hypothetical protein